MAPSPRQGATQTREASSSLATALLAAELEDLSQKGTTERTGAGDPDDDPLEGVPPVPVVQGFAPFPRPAWASGASLAGISLDNDPPDEPWLGLLGPLDLGALAGVSRAGRSIALRLGDAAVGLLGR